MSKLESSLVLVVMAACCHQLHFELTYRLCHHSNSSSWLEPARAKLWLKWAGKSDSSWATCQPKSCLVTSGRVLLDRGASMQTIRCQGKNATWLSTNNKSKPLSLLQSSQCGPLALPMLKPKHNFWVAICQVAISALESDWPDGRHRVKEGSSTVHETHWKMIM